MLTKPIAFRFEQGQLEAVRARCNGYWEKPAEKIREIIRDWLETTPANGQPTKAEQEKNHRPVEDIPGQLKLDREIQRVIRQKKGTKKQKRLRKPGKKGWISSAGLLRLKGLAGKHRRLTRKTTSR